MTNEMVDMYKNMVYYVIAHNFERYPYKDDLFQAGWIGLTMAYNNFNESFNVKFSTYAYPYIWGEMNRFVKQEKGIKISRNIRSLQFKIEKVKSILEQQLMRTPTTQELASFLEVDVSLIEQALMSNVSIQSMDATLVDDGKELNYYDVIEAPGVDLNTLVAMKENISKLSKEERKHFELRYMNDYTQSQTAKILGINQVQVSRNEQKIKMKIAA